MEGSRVGHTTTTVLRNGSRAQAPSSIFELLCAMPETLGPLRAWLQSLAILSTVNCSSGIPPLDRRTSACSTVELCRAVYGCYVFPTERVLLYFLLLRHFFDAVPPNVSPPPPCFPRLIRVRRCSPSYPGKWCCVMDPLSPVHPLEPRSLRDRPASCQRQPPVPDSTFRSSFTVVYFP